MSTSPRRLSGWRAAAGPAGALWASAAVLCGLLVVELGRGGEGAAGSAGGLESSALASMTSMDDVVSSVGDFTVLTFNAGNDDVLALLDGRGEELYFYRVRNQRELEFLGREDLKALFAAGRRIGPGRK
jgi:hypothetical protein